MKIQTVADIDHLGKHPAIVETIREYEREGWQFITLWNEGDRTRVLFDKEVRGLGVC